MTLSMIDILIVAMVIFGLIAGGFVVYSQEQFKATVTEKCEQIIDFNDTKITVVRNGNYVNDVIRYHGYDVCRSTKDGNITYRGDLGYGTEAELKLYGITWGNYYR